MVYNKLWLHKFALVSSFTPIHWYCTSFGQIAPVHSHFHSSLQLSHISSFGRSVLFWDTGMDLLNQQCLWKRTRAHARTPPPFPPNQEQSVFFKYISIGLFCLLYLVLHLDLSLEATVLLGRQLCTAIIRNFKIGAFPKTPTNDAIPLNPLEHTAGCQTVETSLYFACNSSFLSVDGMTCLIPFQSWRNTLSNGVSYV